MELNSGSKYRDQGVQGRSSSPVRQSGEEEDGEEHAQYRKRRGSPVYDEYTDFFLVQGKHKEKSLASYGSWEAGSQTLINASTSGSKSASPYGNYDMDDSNFFAHTTRLNIVGPMPNSTRFRRSSSTERLFTTGAKRLPPVPERRTSPTESYLKLSLQSSPPLADPTTSRKLLVLDLNGTLLLRSAHSARRAPPSSHSRVRHSTATPYHPSHTHPTPRTIHPRPYLPSFSAYLFHPSTSQWLDTMVWSSAQPRSVNDMVDKCFGTYKEKLIAIWARDTLGLSRDEYYKKTQTTKDLDKPWAQIPSIIPNLSHTQPPPQLLSTSRPSENPSSEVKAEVDKNNHTLLPQQHSALTTVLMDDSPLKAVLQPWNHLCVSEYGSKRRKLDVEIAERNLERTWLAERERARKISSLEAAAAAEEEMTGDEATENAYMVLKSNEKADEKNKEAERKRKRQEKKLLKKERLLLAKAQELEVQGEEEIRRVEEKSYDELLLAVIGILDGLKHEGNVAGWMRSGGLTHIVGDQETNPELNANAIDNSATTSMPTSENPTAEGPVVTTNMTIPSPAPSIKHDGSVTSSQGSFKRRRLTHSNSSDNEIDPLISTAITTSTEPSTPTCARQNSLSPESQPFLWYEIPSVLSHWAQRGRKALAELGIEITPGVVPPSLNGSATGGQNLGINS